MSKFVIRMIYDEGNKQELKFINYNLDENMFNLIKIHKIEEIKVKVVTKRGTFYVPLFQVLIFDQKYKDLEEYIKNLKHIKCLSMETIRV